MSRNREMAAYQDDGDGERCRENDHADRLNAALADEAENNRGNGKYCASRKRLYRRHTLMAQQ